jgi:DNA-directed RNA polymerase subunit RPC12/RpoP
MSEQSPSAPPPPPEPSSPPEPASPPQDRARFFPCDSCGADLEFSPGAQKLSCPYCGHEKELSIAEDAEIVEQDLEAMLARIQELREGKRSAEGEGGAGVAAADDGIREVNCGECGAVVQFVGTITSQSCAYCGSPLQLEGVHDAEDRVRVDGVLPFMIDEKKARVNLDAWVKGRWFLPNDMKGKRIGDRFQGVYLPYWTYDSLTTNDYRGERGEHYYVTVGSGKNQRRERRTRWYPASGRFDRFFDDVLIFAGRGLPTNYVDKLEPWPLHELLPWNPEVLAGHMARTYDLELGAGFREAKSRMEKAIEREVRQRIGGDTQRVHSISSHFGALTYKHLLLPLYLLSYRYNEKTYQVVVNAATGEVQGQRPYSWIKITLFVLLMIGIVLGGWWLFEVI